MIARDSISLGPTVRVGDLDALPGQRESIPARCEHLLHEARRAHLEERAHPLEMADPDRAPRSASSASGRYTGSPDREELRQALPIARFPRVAHPVPRGASRRSRCARAVRARPSAHRSGRVPRRRARGRTTRCARCGHPLRSRAASETASRRLRRSTRSVPEWVRRTSNASGCRRRISYSRMAMSSATSSSDRNCWSVASAPRAAQVPKDRASKVSIAGANASARRASSGGSSIDAAERAAAPARARAGPSGSSSACRSYNREMASPRWSVAKTSVRARSSLRVDLEENDLISFRGAEIPDQLRSTRRRGPTA